MPEPIIVALILVVGGIIGSLITYLLNRNKQKADAVVKKTRQGVNAPVSHHLLSQGAFFHFPPRFLPDSAFSTTAVIRAPA